MLSTCLRKASNALPRPALAEGLALPDVHKISAYIVQVPLYLFRHAHSLICDWVFQGGLKVPISVHPMYSRYSSIQQFTSPKAVALYSKSLITKSLLKIVHVRYVMWFYNTNRRPCVTMIVTKAH